MREPSRRCVLCSQAFRADGPFPDDRMPRHLDPLGTPCPGSGRPVPALEDLPAPLQLAGRLHDPWPRYRRRC